MEICSEKEQDLSKPSYKQCSMPMSIAKSHKENASQSNTLFPHKVNYLRGRLSEDTNVKEHNKGSVDIYMSNTPTFSTSDDSDSDEIIQRGAYADAKMRVGRDYQATTPALIGQPGSRCDSPDGALCVWSPPPSAAATEAQLAAFVDLARDRYGYSAEQALAMLYWHKHNIDLATADLPNFVPFPDEWTHEEKLVFEQAFSFQGKQFGKIAHALPDKTVPHLVKYYYQWKKSRAKSTALDKRRKGAGRGGGGGGIGAGAADGSDSESSLSDSELPSLPPGCGRVRARQPPTTQQRQQQSPLKAQSTQRRPTQQGQQRRRRIPHAIFLDYEALLAMAQQSSGENEAIVTALDNRLVTARTQVQRNRAQLAQRWQTLVAEAEAFQEPRTEASISSKWTEDELLLAVQGVRRYGKDFRSIAQLVGTKTEQHVRYFFAQYRAKFSLDSVLAEFCKEASSSAAGVDDTACPASH